MEDRRNPFCYYGWAGLMILIFGGFCLGYGFSRSNFSAHRRGLIIAGGVAIGIICVGILICVVLSWPRKRAATLDEEHRVVSGPTRRQPNQEPPMTVNTNNLYSAGGADAQQRPDQHIFPQQNDVNGLPEKPPPAYSEHPNDRVYRDPNPTSMLNV